MFRFGDRHGERSISHLLVALLVAAVCASVAAWALAPEDESFVKAAANMGTSQLALAKLATEKSDRADLKMFAHQMISDYGRSNHDLKELAAQKKVAVSDSPDLKNSAEKARLELLSGPQFNNAYVTSVIDDYTKGLQIFKGESDDGRDSDVRQFASKNLPILREHLSMAKAIRGKMANP